MSIKKFSSFIAEEPAADYVPQKDSDEEVKGYKPRSKGEEDFANMHNVEKHDYPIDVEDQFTGGVNTKQRQPNNGEKTTTQGSSTVNQPKGGGDSKRTADKKQGDMKVVNPVKEEVELDENKNLIKDYQGMKAQGKKDSDIIDVLMSMPKYKRMDKDQMRKIIGDARRKGIFKEDVELDELKKYDKNKDYQLLNRLSQKAKTGKLTPSEKSQMANAKSRLRNHGFSEEVEMEDESKKINEEFESLFKETTDRHGNTKSFLDAIMSVVTEDNTNDKSDDGEGMDKVQPKALKKKFKDRKDKDIDNDGDVDDSDEYLHKRRKTVSKAVKKDDKEDSSDEEPKGADVGKSGKQTKVDTNPSLSEEEMTSAEKEKMEKIKAKLDKKKDEFVKKYGDRAKEVIARTAIKMAKKSA